MNLKELKLRFQKSVKLSVIKLKIKLKEPGPEINTQIQSFFLGLGSKVEKLKELQKAAESLTGIWAKLKRKPKEEVLNQRREDIRNIEDYIVSLKDKNRGTKTLKIERKEVTTIDNMEDLSKESGIPNVDISEGLKQIEDNKKKIEEALAELIGQVEKMKDHAQNFSEELDKQEKIT